jgi:3-hydroxyisobutyrate dehydrogenase
MKPVAILGLGTMGSGMARRLLGAGFPVTLYNRTRSRTEALAGEGASVAATPREAAAGAEVVIAMLADDAA